ERRVGFADAERRLEFLRHGGRVALHEREKVREATGAGEVELFAGRVLQHRACVGQLIDRKQRGREVAVRGHKLRIETDGLALRSDGGLEVAEASQGGAETVECERFARICGGPRARQLQPLVPRLYGVAVVPP